MTPSPLRDCILFFTCFALAIGAEGIANLLV